MYTPGQMQLQSMAMLNGSTGDRPSFQATICRTFSTRPYQVFVMPNGLLFLERRDKAGEAKNNTNAVVVGAVLGGMIGACIASALVNSNESQAETGLEHLREEDLFELARTRKRSFVAKQEEILLAHATRERADVVTEARGDRRRNVLQRVDAEAVAIG